MSLELRPITPDELEEWIRVEGAAFLNHPRPGDHEREAKRLEWDRSLGAFEDGRIVGTTSLISFRMTLPGGADVPTAGVTDVGVLPTRTRRGVLRAIMRRQLDDVHERGEPLAALWASESLIYGRFGYGNAVLAEHWTLPRAYRALRPGPRARGEVRMVDRDEARRLMPGAYEQARPQRPGMMTIPDTMWDRRTEDREPQSAPFRVVYEVAGEPRGYGAYSVKQDPALGSFYMSALSVDSLIALDDDAYRALWRFLLGVDLVAEYRAPGRAVDEGLPAMLVDPRRLSRHTWDALWVRLVDLRAALEARRYAVHGCLTLEVHDDFCPWNTGTYRLDGGPDGATATPTDASPDLVLPTDALAAAYLGGPRLHTLAQAGLVEERTDGAVARASAMLASPVAPWAPVFF